MGSNERPDSSPAGLRLRLLLLVLLAVIPALGLVAYTAAENRRTLAGDVRQNALRVALLAASEHRATVEGARQLLTGVANTPATRAYRTPACAALMADLLRRFPAYANFGVAELDGEVTCSAVAFEGIVDVRDRLYFREAVRTRDFAVGEFQIGRITGEPTLAFGYPVLDADARVVAVTFAALALASINDIVQNASLPSGAAVTVIDGNGTILARFPNPEQWVGRSVPEAPLARAMLRRDEGTAEAPGVDGVRRLYGYSRLQGGGNVSIAVGIQASAAFGEVNRTFWRTIVGLAIVGVLALIAAWVFGTVFVVRPVVRAIALERDAVRRLEEVDQMRSDFVSMVSHELRNPMATIRGFAQILRDRPESLAGDQRRQAYDAIVRQVDRMAELVDNVLNVSRLESDAFSYAYIPYEPFALLTECVEEAKVAWPAHRFTLDLNGTIPQGTGDRDRLKQVVQNVLSNSSRYSPAGSTVTVRAIADGPRLRIEVSDEGVGISHEDLGKLFQRFARVRTPDTAHVRGTGLGLYISRRIVEAHGGEISAVSEVGRGSTFIVSILLDAKRD